MGPQVAGRVWRGEERPRWLIERDNQITSGPDRPPPPQGGSAFATKVSTFSLSPHHVACVCHGPICHGPVSCCRAGCGLHGPPYRMLYNTGRRLSTLGYSHEALSLWLGGTERGCRRAEGQADVGCWLTL